MAEASKKMVTQLPANGAGIPRSSERCVEILGLFLAPQPIIRRRLADGHRIGTRKSFLEGFIELTIKLALLLRERRSGRGLSGFLAVFHGRAPCVGQRLASLYVRGPLRSLFERHRASAAFQESFAQFAVIARLHRAIQ